MKLLGLTGGIGMGKSTAAKWLQERRVPMVDTDDLARQVVEPGEPALAEIREYFGGNMLGADGRLRRDELARRVFNEPAALAKLEAILHPRIQRLWRGQAARWRAEGRARAAVVIPLLYETGAAADFEAVICVACSAASQRERLRQRGWSPEEMARRSRAQWPVERKMELANYVVWTEGGLEVLAEQLGRIVPG